jgi:hypothetical protein
MDNHVIPAVGAMRDVFSDGSRSETKTKVFCQDVKDVLFFIF